MSKMIKSMAAVSVLAASTLASGAAMAGLSGNVGVTSNYIWRGETQAADEAAVSGGIDYSHDSGFYAGTWTSSLGGGQNYELDFYAGFGFELSGVALDIGAISYQYPAAVTSVDTTEGYIGASYGMFSAKYSMTSDYFGSGDSASYVEVGVDVPVKGDLSLGLHYGLKSGTFFDNNTGGSYGDYSVSLSKGEYSFAYSNTTDNAKANGQSDNFRIAATWTHSIDF